MTGVWMTADLHLGHENVARRRGFKSVDDHDSSVLRMFKGLQEHDTLYILGDVAMGGWETTIVKLSAVPGTKIVVLGNHDRPAPNNKNGHMHLSRYMELGGLTAAVQSCKLRINGVEVMLSHYPYDGDHSDEDRYDEFRLRDSGVPLLHGHTHSSEKLSRSNRGTKQIHVGLDAWGLKPVSLGMVQNLINS